MCFAKPIMNRRASDPRSCAMLALILSAASGSAASGQDAVIDTRNPFGVLRTITLDGSPLDPSNPFFQSLGTNGRSCASCHVASSAWTITPAEVRAPFRRDRRAGPDLPDRRRLELAERGRLHGPGPAQGVQHAAHQGPDPRRPADPGGRGVHARGALTTPTATPSASELSLFRRPLPATNLRFLTAVMWDGRESFAPMGTTPIRSDATPDENAHGPVRRPQAPGQRRDPRARPGRVPLTDDQADAIVQFELNLATAQQKLRHVGELDAQGGQGGPAFVAAQPFYVTINDVLGADASGAAVRSGRDDALRAPGPAPGSASGPRSPGAPGSSARSRSRSRGSAGSTTPSACPRSGAPARPATTAPTSATTRSPCRSTSA